jgi:hypothetical protein
MTDAETTMAPEALRLETLFGFGCGDEFAICAFSFKMTELF